MASFVADSLSDLGEEETNDLRNVVIALSAQAELPYQKGADALAENTGLIEAGRTAMSDSFGCFDCHLLGEDGYEGSAPDLTGYMSAEWLRLMISNPAHERTYGYGEDPSHNDRMPVFYNADDPGRSQLSAEEVDLLVRWLRREAE